MTARGIVRVRDPGRWIRSISGRLILAYMASALATLVLATGFVYWALASSLQEKDEEFLADQIRVLRWILQEHPDDQAFLNEEVMEEPRSDASHVPDARNYYVRVLDAQGNVLVETPGMEQVVAASEFPVAPSQSPPVIAPGRRLSDGRSHLLIAARAALGHDAEERRLLQIALDRSREEHILANYRRLLTAALLGGTLLSVGAAIVVARMGLRPVETMAKAVESIGASRLHERIGTQQWPEELTALAGAFDLMLARLEDSFARLSRFAAELAHQLRTPINVLRGEAEVALSRTRTPEQYRAVLESSLEEYGRLSRVIERLLFLAHAENSDVSLERTKFEARRAVEDIVEFHRPLADEQGVTVICRGDAHVCADSLLFRQAFVNVLENALRYTPVGGSIAVGVESSPDGPVISVSDTGPGIEAEHLPGIFDPFYRAARGESSGDRGTGLGLAIVKSIMDLHGGRVVIESERGKGTTVVLRFPSDEPGKMTSL